MHCKAEIRLLFYSVDDCIRYSINLSLHFEPFYRKHIHVFPDS